MTSPDTPSRQATTYRIQQLGPPRDLDGDIVRIHRTGLQLNESVTGFDSLVLQHPGDNRATRMQDGLFVGGKGDRAYGFIGGRLQDIEVHRRVDGEFRTYGLQPDQVLLKKDFILSHPHMDPMSDRGRSVPVPSPMAGVVGARRDREGLVDILDRPGGHVVARFRHLTDIMVDTGDRVAYGEALGIQGKVRTRSIHVHIEMDTRYYQQFRGYVDDLASGRLPLEAEFRQGVQPRPVIDDGTFRLGESDARIRDLQRVMAAEGYRSAGGGPLDQDGVYRLRMQGALLEFQRDHGLPQTGDVDPPTLQFAPAARRREADRLDHTGAGTFPAPVRQPAAAPGHPDHPDHRPGLPEQPEPPLNQRRAQAGGFADPQLAALLAALGGGDDGLISRRWADVADSPAMQAFIAQGQEALAARDRGLHGEPAREVQDPALPRA
ncbi:peptidoglycan-binding protein [Luteimonas sp. SDU101]|uniref:peptidoglycan-binding protein n=1 Tax=Luteimonas sp. SDU101 TaxID=3422593 RepID=UPI003EB99A4D